MSVSSGVHRLELVICSELKSSDLSETLVTKGDL